MLGVILLLQINSLSQKFFSLVDRLYDATGASVVLRQLGYAFFQFWVKNPA
jgi:hypothetical protein